MSAALLTSLLAGGLSTLSPCILPVLPLVLGANGKQRSWGPLFLALGLTTSFTLSGVFLARSGEFIGLASDQLRTYAAGLMILSGMIFFSIRLQRALNKLLRPLIHMAGKHATKSEGASWVSKFALGGLMGIVWAPCAGPTLGSAISLAAGEKELGDAFILMAVFGIGSSLPLLMVAYSSQTLFLKLRPSLLKGGNQIKQVFATSFVLMGGAILTGLDKTLEAWLLGQLPEWWMNFMTSL